MLDQIEGLVDGVDRGNQEISAGSGELFRGREHEFGHANPIAGVDELHIVRETVAVQGDFRMVVRTEQPSAFPANGAVAESSTFGAASDDADVERHSVAGGQYSVAR